MIGFVGGGNMAEALIRGMVHEGKRDIIVSDPLGDRRTYLEKTYGIKATQDNIEAVKAAEVVVLAVKPQQMEELLNEIASAVTDEHTIVSIAAGITLKYIQDRLKSDRVIRAMPNMAAQVGEGMTALSLCECFGGKGLNTAREIFMASGRVLMLPEKHIDAVTALSGSGPAFIALFIGAMAEAGEKAGLTRDDAMALAVQTAVGTSKLLDGGLEPSRLIEKVRSPGGTTAEGLKVFEEKGLERIVFEALEAARKKAEELSK
jgi:pyrroline-5-carboxylate reductase